MFKGSIMCLLSATVTENCQSASNDTNLYSFSVTLLKDMVG